MIVTTVLLVRTTFPAGIAVCTNASQPLASACAESRPSMMFCRWAANVPSSGTQVSSVRVRTIVEPPVRMSVSSSSVTVPVSPTVPGDTVTLKVGVAITALPHATKADAGMVAVMVSWAVTS